MTRRARVLAICVVVFCLLPPASLVLPGSGAGAATFEIHVTRLSRHLKERMRGVSWHRGCPVALHDLRLIDVSYHGFDGDSHLGRLVVNRDATDALSRTLRAMWDSHFKIRRMHLIDRYGGSDHKSMRADNTSAFNCRYVAGTTSWSQHAYGRAIDINPVENPYVTSSGRVSPKKGARYRDRSQHAKGLIHADGAVVRAFDSVGWGWGGRWSGAKDYQHFSANGS
ncbi:MAG TPA: M15 family metallopeptidase [Actinomycetota bacterium]|nr:M15 family metallopeptidase [Actinomycetota bacterium]